ncbi:hypothetical protein NBRC116493_11870 [Aurantivibrio infirmus]
MSVNSADQPLESLREQTIDQLIMNYGHGKLSLEAFERRLDQALDAKRHDDLSVLSNDLVLEVDSDYIAKKKEELGFNSDATDDEEVDYLISIFSGTKQGGTQEAAKKSRMINFFGGGTLDFSEAKFTSERIEVQNFCFFGGADIIVPENVNVITKGFCIFGGIDNRSSSSKSKSTTIIIENFIFFGGVKIRIKRNIKERWMEFSATVKSIFGQNE